MTIALKFNRYCGILSEEQFTELILKTQYAIPTRNKLYKFLVAGAPLSTWDRPKAQFIRNKLTDLETRGLLK